MTEPYESSEYDVVSIKLHPGMLSILCAIVPLAFGYYATSVPFMVPARWRYRVYIGAPVVALAAALVGLALGIYATRRPETRSLGRLGVVVNATALVLEGLYVYVLNWIFTR